ncbi:hypothetical protein NliqN6_4477 [Naganishia liquefaciens]|uniref:Ribosomal protein S8 n=1 Tax=Naganishia liquefaciens TaxID=104408 RepID=A0A8H3YFT6_9TREE|nr:hypothetical protein NliqN6_4477 [Naganishia liquefaciens]
MHLKSPPANLITQLLTSSRASLARTSLPYTSLALSLTSVLLRHGLVSSVTLGTPAAPEPQAFEGLPPASRRLWVTLKHREGQPVLRRMELVSKGSKRVVVTRDELGRLLTGRRAKNVAGVGMGEILVIRDDQGKGEEQVLEGWEAWRRGKGGEVVCRVG